MAGGSGPQLDVYKRHLQEAFVLHSGLCELMGRLCISSVNRCCCYSLLQLKQALITNTTIPKLHCSNLVHPNQSALTMQVAAERQIRKQPAAAVNGCLCAAAAAAS